MTTTLTQTVASYAAGTTFSNIPDSAREQVKKIVFDEIVGAFFSRHSLAGDLGARYATLAGGTPESRIYATGQKVSAPHAAMANGAAGHGEEVDGAHVVGGHPAASIVHASVAMAERQHATGEDLLNAVALGYDVGVRMVDACGGVYSVKNRFGLQSDALFAFGCAAAAGRLLNLDACRIAHAFALASFGAVGHCALFAERRHISKSLCNGQYAWAGVTGALQASIGLEGHDDILGTDYGVLANWAAPGRHFVTDTLGTEYSVMGANFKFINAGYPIHAPVEAALTLMKEHAIVAEDIQSIDVGMPTDTMKVVDSRDMHNICVQDMLGVAVSEGGISLRGSPFPSILEKPTFQRIRALVTVRGDADLDRDQPAGRGAVVTITTHDGRRCKLRLDYPKGHSLRGQVSWEDLAHKWESGLPECDIPKMISLCRHLEDVTDINQFLDVFRVRA